MRNVLMASATALALMTGIALAGDNNQAYVDQVGDGNQNSQTQTGNGNTAQTSRAATPIMP